MNFTSLILHIGSKLRAENNRLPDSLPNKVKAVHVSVEPFTDKLYKIVAHGLKDDKIFYTKLIGFVNSDGDIFKPANGTTPAPRASGNLTNFLDCINSDGTIKRV